MVLEGPFLVVVLLAALAADGARIPHGRPRRAKKAPRPDSRAVLSPAAEAMLSLVAYQKWTVLGASFPAEKQAILQLERKLQSLGLPLGYAIDLQGELLDDLVNHSAAPTFVTSPLLEADPRPPSLVLVDTGHSDATAEAFRDALRTAGFPDAYADAAADYLVDGLVHHDARPRFVTDSALARRRADVWELLAERHFPADLMEAAIEPETGYVPELLAWIESIPPFDVVQPGLDAAVDLLTKQGMTPKAARRVGVRALASGLVWRRGTMSFTSQRDQDLAAGVTLRDPARAADARTFESTFAKFLDLAGCNSRGDGRFVNSTAHEAATRYLAEAVSPGRFRDGW